MSAPTRPPLMRSIGRLRSSLLTLLCCAATLPAAAQNRIEGPVFRSKAAEIEIGGQVQTQFNTTTADDQPDTELILRRIRLEAKVRINDVVEGKVQPDFAGDRVRLKDAYVKYSFSPALQLLAGKAYRPFARITQVSSTLILPIERGLRVRGVDGFEADNFVEELDYGDRAIGVQLLGAPAGAPLGLTYAVGYFDGPVRAAAGSQDTYQLAGRVTVKPVADLEIGAGVSSRDFALAPLLPEGEAEIERGTAYEVDFEYGGFRPGLHLIGELVAGAFDPFVEADFLGAQGWLAYRTAPLGGTLVHLEPVARVSYGEVDDSSLGGLLVTPGVNLYFGGRNRMMFNYDFWRPDEGDSEGSFKAMFQLHF